MRPTPDNVFKISGSAAITSVDNRYKGAVQFLVAKHAVTGTEVYGFPMFTDNNSFFQNGVACSLDCNDNYCCQDYGACDNRV
jgi:hypothetical protein